MGQTSVRFPSDPGGFPAFQLLFICLFLSIREHLKFVTHSLATRKIPQSEGSV